ncbi:hypothetical protein FRC04_004983 [Tulasnella sp. 424]|nr:hypothetical protein FRC04_004983 [Tulasnella sp. 424]
MTIPSERSARQSEATDHTPHFKPPKNEMKPHARPDCVLNHPTFTTATDKFGDDGGQLYWCSDGNTRDEAALAVDGNATSGTTIDKFKDTNASAVHRAPDVHFTLDLLYAMASMLKLVKAHWFFGIPFFAVDSDGNAGLVEQYARQILGTTLLGLQLAKRTGLVGSSFEETGG